MSAYVDYSSEGEQWGDEEMSMDSILLSMVQSYDWAGTLARIKAFPEECKAVGDQGRTPVHVACDHDAPAVVVAALLQAYPEASLMVGTSNMNPLHITCSSQRASVDVVRVLLESGHNSQTSMRDVDGDTPLHAACRCGAPIDVLRVLLEANPSVVNERDYEGLTPLLRLWVRYFVILGDDGVANVKGSTDLTGDVGVAWSKTELLLRCAHLGSLHSESSKDNHRSNYVFRALHAASAVDCPRPVVKIATKVHPDQLQAFDDNGMTPLLIAAKAPVFKVRDLSDEGYLLEDRIHGDDEGNETSAEEKQGAFQPSVINVLVEADADSARITDTRGRLPLHLAISSGKTWNEGVKAILEAYPDGLTCPDTETGLVPFLQAATTPHADCGTILELLRKDPSLLRVGGQLAKSDDTLMGVTN